jgi:hypothetical protein
VIGSLRERRAGGVAVISALRDRRARTTRIDASGRESLVRERGVAATPTRFPSSTGRRRTNLGPRFPLLGQSVIAR